MKIVIDLPEKVVTAIQNGEDYRYDIHTAIAQGIPYVERPQVTVFAENTSKEEIEDFKNELEKVLEKPKGEWIPIKTRELTEEEKEEYPDCTFMYDCKLPEDGEDVLVTTWAGNVSIDTFCRDDGCYFEYGCDEGDVIAWQPLPEPYKKDGEEE